jgi:polysaccharide biosynthesis/export protein
MRILQGIMTRNIVLLSIAVTTLLVGKIMRIDRQLTALFSVLMLGANLNCLAATQPVAPQLKAQSASLDTSTPTRAPVTTPEAKLYKIHAGVSDEYILGPGDVLSVTDMTEDKPSTSISPILPDGTAVTSYTGVIQAAGLSLRQINNLVNEEAKKWYVSPMIVLNLAKQRATQIYLLGEVVHPGLYSTGSDAAPMPASDSASESGEDGEKGSGGGSGAGGAGAGPTLSLTGALQLAGGVKETADVRHLRVTRLAPRQTFQVDLWKLMLDGDVSEDIVLQPGDVVYVPKGGADFNPSDFGMLVNVAPKVRVIGAVKTPGLLAMSPDDDLISVISKAGGFQDYASTRYVLLARTSRDGTVTTEKVEFKKGLKDGHSQLRGKIHSGDIIIVKRSATKTVAITLGKQIPSMVMMGAMIPLESAITRP